MIVNVKVHSSAKQNLVKKIDDSNFEIYTTASPHDNEANKAILKLLSNFLKIPVSLITITKGQKNKNKSIKIDNGSVVEYAFKTKTDRTKSKIFKIDDVYKKR